MYVHQIAKNHFFTDEFILYLQMYQKVQKKKKRVILVLKINFGVQIHLNKE